MQCGVAGRSLVCDDDVVGAGAVTGLDDAVDHDSVGKQVVAIDYHAEVDAEFTRFVETALTFVLYAYRGEYLPFLAISTNPLSSGCTDVVISISSGCLAHSRRPIRCSIARRPQIDAMIFPGRLDLSRTDRKMADLIGAAVKPRWQST